NDATLRTGLPALLSSALRASDKLSVVPPSTVTTALTSLRLSDVKVLANDDRTRLARYLAAPPIVTGRVRPQGAGRRLAYILADGSGRLLRAGRADQKNGILVQPLASKAAGELLSALDPVGDRRAFEPVVSEEAVAEYAVAAEESERGNLPAAI